MKPSREQILTITIERTGEEIDTTGAPLASIPVCLWSWNAVNHVTGEAVTPEERFATGEFPIVTVDCKVMRGTVEFTDLVYNECIGTFSGAISVETMINGVANPWHFHDAELIALNQDASCTTDGYADRTYCQTCKSVVDWGTVLPATGHTFDLDGKCTTCGKETVLNGLCETGDSWYYYIDGKAVSGWQMIGTDWYYFDPATQIGAEGDVKIGLITFNFEHGRLTAGVWANPLFGSRYYYGPDYYNDRGSWRNIDGKYYYFDYKGYAQKNGTYAGRLFKDDYTAYTGLLEKNGVLYYYVDGRTATCGLFEIDGYYTAAITSAFAY